MQDMLKLGLFLFVVCAVAAGALSGTYLLTNPRIEAQKKVELETALKEVFPSAAQFKETTKTIKGIKESFYLGLDKKGDKMGVVIKASQKGYGGLIEMIVGIDKSGKVVGVKVLSQKETPGLGTGIMESKFLDQFKGRTKEDRLKAKLDIQAITGATISSQGISSGVKEAIEKFRKIF